LAVGAFDAAAAAADRRPFARAKPLRVGVVAADAEAGVCWLEMAPGPPRELALIPDE
jgi:hypothetical protein